MRPSFEQRATSDGFGGLSEIEPGSLGRGEERRGGGRGGGGGDESPVDS